MVPNINLMKKCVHSDIPTLVNVSKFQSRITYLQKHSFDCLSCDAELSNVLFLRTPTQKFEFIMVI